VFLQTTELDSALGVAEKLRCAVGKRLWQPAGTASANHQLGSPATTTTSTSTPIMRRRQCSIPGQGGAAQPRGECRTRRWRPRTQYRLL